MKRHVAAAGIAFLLVMGSAREGHVTIVSNSSRVFPGFHVTTTEQIGCESTGDEPSEETYESAQKAGTAIIDRAEPVLRRAFDHFLHGKHPYTRSRAWVSLESANPDDYDPNAPRGMWVGQVEIFVHVKKDTPAPIAEKLPFELVLSQFFEGGVLRNDADRAALGMRPLEEWQLANELGSFHPMFPHKFAGLLSAISSPAQYEKLLASDKPHVAARAKAFEHLLRGAPLDDALMAQVRALEADERFFLTYLLVLLSPLEKHDRAVLRAFVDDGLEKDARRDVLTSGYTSLLAD